MYLIVFFFNWYQLLKLVQKHGTIEKFDLLFHRSGCPQAGQPRGYAFVTYKTASDAEQAKEALHNLKIGAKNIIVRWANTVNEVRIEFMPKYFTEKFRFLFRIFFDSII